MGLSIKEIAGMIDHTLLRPETTKEDIAGLCVEAKKYGFASVCVNPVHVRLCAGVLWGVSVKVGTVVGFPLGANASQVKSFEATVAVGEGANEVDMVINIGALKERDYDCVEEDIRSVVEATGSGVVVKVILETSLLTEEEKVVACQLAKKAGADFVKTSTGWGLGGARVEDVALMRRVVGEEMGVKAAGGIRDYDTALRMVAAGANRIGTSAGVKIVLRGDTDPKG